MNYLKNIKNNLPGGFAVEGDGYMYIPIARTTLFYNFKRINKNIKLWDTENRLYTYTENTQKILYIIDLKSKEGVKCFYTLQLQKELELSKGISAIKKETLLVLNKALNYTHTGDSDGIS